MRPVFASIPWLLATLALPALAQGVEAVEIELPDGGVPVELTPPVLVTDSRAEWPEGAELGVEPDSGRAAPQGTVGLELLVDVEGNVTVTEVRRSLHPLFDQAAVKAASRLRFVPARLGPEAVAVKIAFDYHFLRPPPVGVLRLLVRERGTREPIAGAQAFTPDGLSIGATDSAGVLRVELPPGPVELTVAASGHAPATVRCELAAKEEQGLLLRLDPAGAGSYETVVRGDRMSFDLGRVALREEEVREVPGTLGDPLRVVMLMPGVGQVASGVSYPVVRGSLPAATATYVDGVRVPILFHLLLGPSVVHPEAIERIDFTPGVPGADKGRLMSGTVEAKLREPSAQLRGVAAADLINAGGVAHRVFPSTRSELLVAGRFSYTPWLLTRLDVLGDGPPEERSRLQADFWDYLARLEQPWKGGQTRILALGSSDLVGSDSPLPEGLDTSMITRFHRVDLRDRRPLGAGELELGAFAGLQTAGVLGSRESQRLDLLLEQQELGSRAAWRLRTQGPWSFRAGADAERLASTTRGGGDASQRTVLLPRAHGTQLGAFLEGQWSTPGWSVVAGARGDAYHLVPGLTRWSFDPRLTVRRALGSDWTVQLSAGSAHQAPTALLPVPVLDLAGLRYGVQESWQLDGSVAWAPAPGWDLRANAYAARLTRAIELDLERLLRNVRSGRHLESDPSTTGSAMGLELMARKHLGGRWYGWASYSLQRSVRVRTFVRFDARGLPLEERTAEVPFAFDQTHVGNLALSFRLPGGITLGASVRAQTGRPESGQLSSRTMVREIDPASGQPQWRAVDLDRVQRLPGFVRLDLRAAKRWSLDDFWLEASVDLQNASFSEEVLGYEYGSATNPRTFERGLTRTRIAVPVVLPLLGLKAGF